LDDRLALPVENSSDVRLVVLVVLRYIPAEVTPGVNVSKALLNGSSLRRIEPPLSRDTIT
jgi:hypothetical protein